MVHSIIVCLHLKIFGADTKIVMNFIKRILKYYLDIRLRRCSRKYVLIIILPSCFLIRLFINNYFEKNFFSFKGSEEKQFQHEETVARKVMRRNFFLKTNQKRINNFDMQCFNNRLTQVERETLPLNVSQNI